MTGWMLLGLLVALVSGLIAGLVPTRLLLRARFEADVAHVLAERDQLRLRVAQLSESVESNQELAMTVAPLKSSLARMEATVERLQKEHSEGSGRLSAQLATVAAGEEALRQQTASLAGALRSTGIRGNWGEVQLRRIVEHAGLLERVDISTQAAAVNDLGASIRPDAVVHLPGGKQLIIDAKAPLGEDDAAQAQLLKAHVNSLAGKRYWTAFTPTPELVICFIPSEGLLAAACRADPGLVEQAMAKRIVVASPTTLLTMLKAVALTWQQDALVGNAQQVVQLGRQLHQRLLELGEHTAKLGRTLNRAVVDYNALAATTETKVLSKARTLGELGVTATPIATVPELSAQARPPTGLVVLHPVPPDEDEELAEDVVPQPEWGWASGP